MVFQCPYCEEKLNPIHKFPVVCSHIIAFFSYVVSPYFFREIKELRFVSPKIANILANEGLPFMGLYNFIQSNLDKSVSSDNLAVDDDSYSYEIYYTQDMEDFLSLFYDFIVDLNFDFRQVAARRLYWYNSLFIDKIKRNTKIRPFFDASGHINFDWNIATTKMIKDCIKELDERKLLDDERIEDRFFIEDKIPLGQYILNRIEGNDNIRELTVLTICDIFTEHTSYHNKINKWLLQYL